MTDPAVHASPTAGANAPANAADPGFGARHRRGFIAAAAVGFLLALVGAMETTQLPFLPRLLYWEILMLSGAVVGLGVSDAVERWGRLRTRPALEMPLIAALIALPLSLVVVGTSAIFFGIRAPGLSALSIMFGLTFIISLAMTTLNYLLHAPTPDTAPPRAVPEGAPAAAIQAATAAAAPPAQTVPEDTRLAQRLPLALRGLGIIALEAEDHYLRVHVRGGQSSLILLRLSDAVAELPADLGAQTHRSWWVAKDAVRAVAKADGRATLTLEGGITAPVSRSHYKTLAGSGWLV